MVKFILLFMLLWFNSLFAGPQYVDIQNSYVTVDFSKLGIHSPITNDGSGKGWVGTLPLQVNSETYNNNEYIWYDAANDDKVDGNYIYPYDTAFGPQTADIQQFRVCRDSTNVYLFLKLYGTNQVFRCATVIGIDTDNGKTGNFDLQEGDASNPVLGCASKLRSTKIKCNFTIFSKLEENWGSWFGTNSRIQESGIVHSGLYSMKADLRGGPGGTIDINPEAQSFVDMSHATNFNFWVYDTFDNDTVQLRLIDSSGNQSDISWSDWSGYATHTHAILNTWAEISIPLTNFRYEDLTHIAQIQLYEANSATYYFDDLSYDSTMYNDFETNKSTYLWDAQGNLHYLMGQPMGSKIWEIKIPISLLGDPTGKQWHFIVGAGFHENNVCRPVEPFNNGVTLQWYGTGSKGLWWDNKESPNPNIYDLIGAPIVSQQVKDLASYQPIATTNERGNLENLNVTISPAFFNPKQQQMDIGLTLPTTCTISIDILQMDGEKLYNIFNKTIVPPANGYYEILWNGRNSNNELLKLGTYIMKIQYSGQGQSRIIYKYFKTWR